MLLYIRKITRRYKYLIDKSFRNPKHSHQGFLAGFFGLIGAIISFCTALNSLFLQLYTLSACLFLSSGLLLMSFYILKSTAYYRFHDIARYVALMGLFVLGIYLIYSGGVNNSGPLWVYVIPSVTFAFFGLKRGVFLNGLFCIVLLFMLFFPNDVLLATTYSYEFKTRLIYVFLTIFALSGFYELARMRSYLQLKALTTKYEHQAQIDDLTLLPNRRSMRKTLKKEYRRTRSCDCIATIATFDIDKFKNINDNFGHEVGDKVLKHLSNVLRLNIRSQDSLARWGGEEFLLLLPDTREPEAIVLLESIRERVEKTPFEHGNVSIFITLSVGLCETSPDVDFNDTIKFSDIGLYRAKQAGRNTVFAYSPEL